MNNFSDGKSQLVDGIEYTYYSDWINNFESKEHWRLYWEQINLVLNELKERDTLLEIGPGTGFLSNYLRSKGYQVTTLDIDKQKSPDIQCNIVEYAFPDQYDHIIAFEVFEHIPYDKFTEILPKLRKSARKNLFFSLPRNYKVWFSFELDITYIRKFSFTFKTKRRKIKTITHFWELDYKDFTLKNLEVLTKDAGFKTAKTITESQAAFIQLIPVS